jgi:AcrR family transcriptional regulator
MYHRQCKEGDRRANRTRRLLSDALIQLLLEKHYDTITVQDVIDRADVGRSTFYTHYRGKEDLFRKDFENFFEGFAHQFAWDNLKEGRLVPLKEFFQHVQDFHQFYRALVRSRKTDLLFKSGLNDLSHNIETLLTTKLSNEPQPSIPIPIMAHYLASEILALLKWWLDRSMPYPAERMDEMFHELVMPGFRAALFKQDVGCMKSLKLNA